jgi:hypothetical protein
MMLSPRIARIITDSEEREIRGSEAIGETDRCRRRKAATRKKIPVNKNPWQRRNFHILINEFLFTGIFLSGPCGATIQNSACRTS